jgi:hypothetical protein
VLDEKEARSGLLEMSENFYCVFPLFSGRQDRRGNLKVKLKNEK